MPNPLAVTLHASAAETTDGTGPVIDVGDRSYIELQLDVTAISSNTTLTVNVETSATQSNWTLAMRITPALAAGYTPVIVPDVRKYIRATWTIAGTSPSATFAATGKAHQLYTKPADVQQYLNTEKTTLANLSLVDIARSCYNASSEAEGYLVSGPSTPILTIDAATRQHITALAVYDLLRFRYGYGDQSSAGTRIEVDRNEAIKWLQNLAAGRVKPPELTYTTPTDPDDPAYVNSYSSYVVSSPSRGWNR